MRIVFLGILGLLLGIRPVTLFGSDTSNATTASASAGFISGEPRATGSACETIALLSSADDSNDLAKLYEGMIKWGMDSGLLSTPKLRQMHGGNLFELPGTSASEVGHYELLLRRLRAKAERLGVLEELERLSREHLRQTIEAAGQAREAQESSRRSQEVLSSMVGRFPLPVEPSWAFALENGGRRVVLGSSFFDRKGQRQKGFRVPKGTVYHAAIFDTAGKKLVVLPCPGEPFTVSNKRRLTSDGRLGVSTLSEQVVHSPSNQLIVAGRYYLHAFRLSDLTKAWKQDVRNTTEQLATMVAAGRQRPIVAVSHGEPYPRPSGKTGSISVWSVNDGEFLSHLPQSEEIPLALSFNEDDTALLAVGLEGKLRQWAIPSGQRNRKAPKVFNFAPGRSTAVAFQPKGNRLIGADMGPADEWEANQRLTMIDTGNGEILGHFYLPFSGGTPPEVTSLSFSPDGKHFGAITTDGEVLLWETETFAKEIKELTPR